MTRDELIALLKKADYEWTFDGQNVIDDLERDNMGYVSEIMHNLPQIIELLQKYD